MSPPSDGCRCLLFGHAGEQISLDFLIDGKAEEDRRPIVLEVIPFEGRSCTFVPTIPKVTDGSQQLPRFAPHSHRPTRPVTRCSSGWMRTGLGTCRSARSRSQ